MAHILAFSGHNHPLTLTSEVILKYKCIFNHIIASEYIIGIKSQHIHQFSLWSRFDILVCTFWWLLPPLTVLQYSHSYFKSWKTYLYSWFSVSISCGYPKGPGWHLSNAKRYYWIPLCPFLDFRQNSHLLSWSKFMNMHNTSWFRLVRSSQTYLKIPMVPLAED